MAGIRKIEFGVESNSATKWLEPIVCGWGKALERYASMNMDAGYYYNERANIGFLAAGAWLAGYSALEEYPDKKRHPKISGSREPKRPRTSKGSERVDLYIASPKRDAVLEAKMLWGIAGKSTLAHKMADAVKDAKKDRNAKQRIACVFYVPDFPKVRKGQKSIGNDDIRGELNHFINARDADLWAWCFPEAARQLISVGKDEEFYYPGIITALKVIA